MINKSALLDTKVHPDADKTAASWRIPIGESGLLDFFLGILAVDGLRQSLKIHTLRLIGNSCADEGECTAADKHPESSSFSLTL